MVERAVILAVVLLHDSRLVLTGTIHAPPDSFARTMTERLKADEPDVTVVTTDDVVEYLRDRVDYA